MGTLAKKTGKCGKNKKVKEKGQIKQKSIDTDYITYYNSTA